MFALFSPQDVRGFRTIAAFMESSGALRTPAQGQNRGEQRCGHGNPACGVWGCAFL